MLSSYILFQGSKKLFEGGSLVVLWEPAPLDDVFQLSLMKSGEGLTAAVADLPDDELTRCAGKGQRHCHQLIDYGADGRAHV